MEAAHVFTVQLSSVIAFIASLIALILLWLSLHKFSPSIVKVLVIYLIVQTVMLFFSMGFMVGYHVFDINFMQDAWHVGAMLSLLIGVVVTVQTVRICKKFYIK